MTWCSPWDDVQYKSHNIQNMITRVGDKLSCAYLQIKWYNLWRSLDKSQSEETTFHMEMQKGGWKGWARDTRKKWLRKCKTPSTIQIVSEKKKKKKAWMQNLQSLYLGRKDQAWNKALWLLLGEGVEIWIILESQGLKGSACGLFKFFKKINIQQFKILLSFSFHGPYMQGHMSQVAIVPRYLRCVFEPGSWKL